MKHPLLLFAALCFSRAAAACQHVSRRPQIQPSPKDPRLPVPRPPERTKCCVVVGHGDGVTDDSDRILSAFHECNNGGHVVLSSGQTYIVGTAMDWTFLKHIDIGMTTVCAPSPWMFPWVPPFHTPDSWKLTMSHRNPGEGSVY